MKLPKTIIWDWNGTLLNDAMICIDSMNDLLEARSLPKLNIERYREIFTFPVRDYYLAAGFDFNEEPFEIPAMQFIELYRKAVKKASLHQGSREILQTLNNSGYRQHVLSVMEQQLLLKSISDLGISDFFEQIAGIDNHYGNGKTKLAGKLLNTIGTDPENLILIGDTLHDHEVAEANGIPCILISHGHQSYERLKSSGRVVCHNFTDLPDLL